MTSTISHHASLRPATLVNIGCDANRNERSESWPRQIDKISSARYSALNFSTVKHNNPTTPTSFPHLLTTKQPKMQSILRKGASLFTPSPSTPSSTVDEKEGFEVSGADGFKSISSHDDLFTKVNPAVDGEECLHDCSSCTVKYPAKFEVDMEDKLYGHVNGWATHLLVATGKTDWVRDVADEKGSVMEAVEKGGIEPSNGVCFSSLELDLIANTCFTGAQTISLEYPRPRRVLRTRAGPTTNNSPPSSKLHDNRSRNSGASPRSNQILHQPSPHNNHTPRIHPSPRTRSRARLGTLPRARQPPRPHKPHPPPPTNQPPLCRNPPLLPKNARRALRPISPITETRIRAPSAPPRSIPRSRRPKTRRSRFIFYQSCRRPQVFSELHSLPTEGFRLV